MPTYRGSCHCGAMTFELESEPITSAVRCNCSLCHRRGAVMSARYYQPAEITITGKGALALYIFGDRMMNHYFCRTCGVFPFSEVIETGLYRVNLACVDGVEPLQLPVTAIDGRSF